MRGTLDKAFLLTTLLLVVFGFFIFISASLGLLVRDGPSFASTASKQLVVGIFLGGLALFTASQISYRVWRTYALVVFTFSIATTLLVFVPDLGLEFGGAQRWLSLGPFSFQPAEFLKLGYILYIATWLASRGEKIRKPMYGLVPLLVLSGAVGAILLAQPDTGTFLIMFGTAVSMFLAAGARTRDIAVLGAIALVVIGVLAFSRPYLMERFVTFLDPSTDPLGKSYQIQQSLIAIGSGELYGRGFGQSIQKFNFLPEPIGDSIFAVFAEEFGFIGAVFLILLFVFFSIRGLKIAGRAPDRFGGLVALGLVILIISQSFLNIASMLGVLPLVGVPLLFVSHGGSALFFALLEVGIILNISKYRKLTA